MFLFLCSTTHLLSQTFFIGGGGTFGARNIQSFPDEDVILATSDILLNSREEAGNGINLKIGYIHSKNWRAILSNYFFVTEITNSQILLHTINFNYIFDSGWFLGIGQGLGSITIKDSNKNSGTAYIFNTGYTFKRRKFNNTI